MTPASKLPMLVVGRALGPEPGIGMGSSSLSTTRNQLKYDGRNVLHGLSN